MPSVVAHAIHSSDRPSALSASELDKLGARNSHLDHVLARFFSLSHVAGHPSRAVLCPLNHMGGALPTDISTQVEHSIFTSLSLLTYRHTPLCLRSTSSSLGSRDRTTNRLPTGPPPSRA